LIWPKKTNVRESVEKSITNIILLLSTKKIVNHIIKRNKQINTNKPINFKKEKTNHDMALYPQNTSASKKKCFNESKH